MPGSNGQTDQHIDKRDFDANRPLLLASDQGGSNEEWNPDPDRSRPISHYSRRSGDSRRGVGSDDGLLSDVVDGIVERDRRKMHKEVVRVISFAWGVITWYDCPGSCSVMVMLGC
jgi:hypothetical protein